MTLLSRTLAIALFSFLPITSAVRAANPSPPTSKRPTSLRSAPCPPRPGLHSADRRTREAHGPGRAHDRRPEPRQRGEWSSVCVVDLADPARPRVGGWEADNFVLPGQRLQGLRGGRGDPRGLRRRARAGRPDHRVGQHMRADTRLTTGQAVTLAEVLRLVCQYSDNTAANVAIDTVDRQRASALLRAMGLRGSDITRKFLPRTREGRRLHHRAGHNLLRAPLRHLPVGRRERRRGAAAAAAG